MLAGGVWRIKKKIIEKIVFVEGKSIKKYKKKTKIEKNDLNSALVYKE